MNRPHLAAEMPSHRPISRAKIKYFCVSAKFFNEKITHMRFSRGDLACSEGCLLLILLVSIDDDAGNDQHDNECNVIPFHSVNWGFIGLEIE